MVEKALEAAGLMLGNDRSWDYCLEMICADFLAGARLGETQQRFALVVMGSVTEGVGNVEPATRTRGGVRVEYSRCHLQNPCRAGKLLESHSFQHTASNEVGFLMRR